jgi:hypothetical protein
MPRSRATFFACAGLLTSVVSGLTAGCDERPCDATALERALAAAGAGDVVEVGACRIAGAFEIPDGVIVRGASGSTLVSVDERPVLEALGGARVEHLAIEVDHGGLGVVARAGSLSLEDLEVRVSRGVGLGVEGSSLSATRVHVTGPITAENAAFAPMSASETGTFGLVARALDPEDTITLDAVHLRGLAVAGVSIDGGALTWRGAAEGADVEGVRGVGLATFGTSTTLSSVEITSMLAGVGMPGIGVVASAESALEAEGLEVHDGAGYGLFADDSAVTLAGGTRMADLGLMGVRLQGGSLDATGLVAERNGGAGVMAIDTVRVHLEGGRLDAQESALFVTMLGSVEIGDGIQVVRDPRTGDAPPIDLALVDVSISDNVRAGLLLDASDDARTTLRLEGVTVSATGAGYGAIAQRTPLAAGWDATVSRSGAAAANDAAFSTPIDVVGIMMPPGVVASPPPF